MRGAIESAALAVGMARRVGLKAQKSECQSQSADHNTPKNPPSAPAHSARPTQKHANPWLCYFQKTIAGAEPAEKILGTTDLDTNMHQKCKLQAASCAFHASSHFLHHIFSKMLFLLERGPHFCKTTSNDFNQKFHFFDPQTASIRAFFVI